MAGAFQMLVGRATVTVPDGTVLEKARAHVRDGRLTVRLASGDELVEPVEGVAKTGRGKWTVTTAAGTWSVVKAGGCGCRG